jgi:hypothetical protein
MWYMIKDSVKNKYVEPEIDLYDIRYDSWRTQVQFLSDQVVY